MSERIPESPNSERRQQAGRRRARAWRIVVVLLTAAVALLLYRRGAMWSSAEDLQGRGAGFVTAFIIVVVMTASLTCCITASHFLILTPLLFPPHWSALITTTGSVLGAAGGYCIARFVGGAWAERFQDGRVQRFLSAHSSFLALFGLRLAPSPHSFINYAAGLARIPPARFLAATLAAMSIKSYVYAVAVQNSLGAPSLSNIVSAPGVLSLFAVAALSIIGHILTRRATILQAASPSISNRAG
ncbi:MAG: TVP38/TMEM64 family protein [Pyrinomonadaceae bacterium]